MTRNCRIAARALLAAAALLPGLAGAQFANLPQNDFTWQWGEPRGGRGFTDIDVNGNESGFRCNLTGELRAGSRLSPMQVRQLESELNVSLYFIQTAANAMNRLDAQRELDWAVLECVRPEEREADEDRRQERLDRARERAERRQAERRERQRQEEEED